MIRMRSLCQAVVPVMPRTMMPSEAWATVMAMAERGKWTSRLRLEPTGMRNSRMRSASSVSAPVISQTARVTPRMAKAGPSLSRMVARVANPVIIAAALSRDSAPARSPRFQASSGPTASGAK